MAVVPLVEVPVAVVAPWPLAPVAMSPAAVMPPWRPGARRGRGACRSCGAAGGCSPPGEETVPERPQVVRLRASGLRLGGCPLAWRPWPWCPWPVPVVPVAPVVDGSLSGTPAGQHAPAVCEGGGRARPKVVRRQGGRGVRQEVVCLRGGRQACPEVVRRRGEETGLGWPRVVCLRATGLRLGVQNTVCRI